MFSSTGGGEDTYTEVSGGTAPAGDVGKGGGIMLFGVRLMEEGTFRKSASMNNLALFEEQPHDSNIDAANPGYASDDVVHPSARSRERKRGVPWTEEEHKLFLIGLQKVGKGDWRGISRNFVKSRTPTQVASHAQKYFLRRNNSSRRRRRSSLFDITTDAVTSGSTAFEDGVQQESLTLPSMRQQNLISNLENYPMPTLTPAISPANGVSPREGLIKAQKSQLKSTSPKFIRPIPVIPIPPTSKLANLNLNKTVKSTMNDPLPLSLKISSSSLSSPSSSPEKQTTPRHTTAFQAMPSNSFDSSGGDSIISVA